TERDEYAQTWRRYNVAAAPGHYAMRLDGSTMQTWDRHTVGWRQDGFFLGVASATTNDANNGWRGWFGAILIFDRVLDPTEREFVDQWLTVHPSGGHGAPPPPPPAVTRPRLFLGPRT